TKNYLTTAAFFGLVRRREDATTVRANEFDIDSRRFLRNRWYVLGQFTVQENTELNLNLRTLVYGAVGRTLVQSNRTVLRVHGGIDWDHEDYEGIPTENSAEA